MLRKVALAVYTRMIKVYHLFALDKEEKTEYLIEKKLLKYYSSSLLHKAKIKYYRLKVFYKFMLYI